MSSSFKLVSSRANPVFKQLRLDVRDAGRPGGPVWLDGVHLCQEYWQRVGVPTLAVFDSAALASGRAEVRALRAELPADCVLVLEGGLLSSVSDIAGAQGVGFLVANPQASAPQSVVDGDCVVLDGVQDPGNVGSILRTCAAAGIASVVLTAGSAAAWSPKVLRAGQGAHFALTIVEGVSVDELARRVSAPLIVTSLDEAQSLYATDLALPSPAAWCFGHEGQGVSPALLARASVRVQIPQTRGVESLNVAAAAAVCLFEHRRRRLQGAR